MRREATDAFLPALQSGEDLIHHIARDNPRQRAKGNMIGEVTRTIQSHAERILWESQERPARRHLPSRLQQSAGPLPQGRADNHVPSTRVTRTKIILVCRW